MAASDPLDLRPTTATSGPEPAGDGTVGYEAPPGATGGASPANQPPVSGYEILGELGRGGMGVVYKARQTALKRLVALKMILAGGHAGAEQRARFRSEAEAVARLQHPNIVQIYEVGEADGHPFCALEFVEGGTLTQMLAGTPLPAEQAGALVRDLSGAVQAAHEAGVVHRDLKPANVLLTLEGVPKVTDFGLAKRMDEESGQTQTGSIMGTPSYMAPEQAEGRTRDVGPAADVYSLGAILYECLTGRPPFKAATALETLEQVRWNEPIPPSRFQPRVPRDLETVCLKCLHKEPRRRYRTARAVAEDLGRWLRGEPIKARRTGALERGWRWCRRNPLLAGVTAAAVLGLVLTTAFALLAAWQAWTIAARAQIEAAKAQEEADKERDRRRLSLLEQAHAQRLAGDRWKALELLKVAADLNPDEELRAQLRQEAIEAIATPGVRLVREKSWPLFGQAGTRMLFSPEELPQFPEVTGASIPPNAPPVGLLPADLELQATGADGQTALVRRRPVGGDPGRIWLWDCASRKTVGVLPESVTEARSYALSEDRRLLAVPDQGDPTSVQVYDLLTGESLGRLRGKRRSGAPLLQATQVAARFNPDHTLLAWPQGGGKEPLLTVQELGSGKILRTLPGLVPDRWSADGRYLQTIGRTYGPAQEVRGSGLANNLGNMDLDLEASQLWEVVSPVSAYEMEDRVWRLQFAPEGDRLLTTTRGWQVEAGQRDRRGSTRIWEATSVAGRPVLRGTTDPAVGLDVPAVIASGRVWGVASSNWSLILRDGTGAKVVHIPFSWLPRQENDAREATFYRATQLWFSPDGKRVLVAYCKEQIEHEKLAREAAAAVAACLGLPEVGVYPVVANLPFGPLHPTHRAGMWRGSEYPGIAELWDLDRGEKVETIDRFGNPEYGPSSVVFDAGKPYVYSWYVARTTFVMNREGKTARKIEEFEVGLYALDGKKVRSWPTDRRATLLALSPDGLTSAEADATGVVRLRDTSTSRELARWQAHETRVSALTFHPDGQTLVTGATDGTIKLWPLPAIRKELAVLGLDW